MKFSLQWRSLVAKSGINVKGRFAVVEEAAVGRQWGLGERKLRPQKTEISNTWWLNAFYNEWSRRRWIAFGIYLDTIKYQVTSSCIANINYVLPWSTVTVAMFSFIRYGNCKQIISKINHCSEQWIQRHVSVSRTNKKFSMYTFVNEYSLMITSLFLITYYSS